MIDAWATYLLLKLQHFENGRGLLLVIHYTREKVPQEHRGALIKKGGPSGPGQWARRLTGKICLAE